MASQFWRWYADRQFHRWEKTVLWDMVEPYRPHLLHCGRLPHLPSLPGCRRRTRPLRRVLAVAMEPTPAAAAPSRPKPRNPNGISSTVSKEIQRVRKQMEEDEQLASLMRGLRGQNLRDAQFADDNVRLRLVEGRLKEIGDLVAVKVQRPFVLETVTIDLFIIRKLGLVLRRFPQVSLDVVGLGDEWAALFLKNFDYVHEGENSSRFAEMMREDLPQILTSHDVMKRLEEDESNWPSRKDVVACASVSRTWREMCKDIVRNPEICGKLTFPVSLKQPGPRDGVIQCFIKRDKSKLTYHLYLCLSSAVLDENGKFLLAAKRSRRVTYTDYIISMDTKNISRSSSGYIGKLRSNFLGTKFIIYDTQPPYNAGTLCSQERNSRRFSSRKVSPKVPTGSYPIAQVNYELNVLGTRGPRRMQCTMHSIPASAAEPDGTVPGQPKELLPRLFEESFHSTTTSFSKYSIADHSTDFSSARFSEFAGGTLQDGSDADKEKPLVLRNKAPRWHEQLQCWCLNFRGRVTVRLSTEQCKI